MLNPQKVGLALGGTVGVIHLVWSLLVALGWALPLMNFIMSLHMMKSSMSVEPFSLVTALGLVIVSSLVGYLFGFLFASVWNQVQK